MNIPIYLPNELPRKLASGAGAGLIATLPMSLLMYLRHEAREASSL